MLTENRMWMSERDREALCTSSKGKENIPLVHCNRIFAIGHQIIIILHSSYDEIECTVLSL